MSPFLLLFLVTTSLAEEAIVTPQNASATIIRCPVAEQFIQTHMAPDFESPQLVLRLDWFHDEALVASYTQNIIADASRQWWVADSRFQLQRPFYSLQLSPVLPGDAGTYRCRLETDPLFSLDKTTSQMELNVMVKPSPPSSPEIKSTSNRSVTLTWHHGTAKAHRPIFRYSVGVRLVSDGSRFIIPAPSNATSVIVDNLAPFSLYSFAVRAENAAGKSDFGPETMQRTLGEAPAYSPKIHAITNSSEGCVAITVEQPFNMHGDLLAYLVSLAGEGLKPVSERFGQGVGPLTICGLRPQTAYTVSIIVETEFGRSPPAQHTFHTDLSVPQTAPGNVTVHAVVGTPRLIVKWKPPEKATDIIQYNIYHKAHGQVKWKVERLQVDGGTSFKHDIIGLAPRTIYSIRVSASSTKGEGPRSFEQTISTDIIIPPSVEIEKVSYDCHEGVFIQWSPAIEGRPEYRVEIGNISNTMSFNTTKNNIQLSHLHLFEEYSVRVAAIQRSTIDNSTLLQGTWGMEQRFLLSKGCQYQSSLCSSGTNKCQPLVAAVPARSFPVLLFILAMGSFLLLCLFIFFFLKGRCIDVKTLLKKKEKCVYLDELTPLVYDSAGFEDIPLELFYGYCEDLARNNNAKYKLQFEAVVETIYSMFQQIEQMTCIPMAEPDILEKNLDKNRYLNIGTIETSRVRLHSSSDSDYINASWIDSCDKKNTYIATQAPLPSTFGDFWAMIWQERCNIIVVITNLVEDGRRKCDQYWPSAPSTPQNYGAYHVTLISEASNAYFSHRIFNVKISKCVPPTERRVHQLHFLKWPDHGVPDTVFPLLNFMHFVSDIHTTGPIVVHCSAGVGRSGSYILVDSMRRHLSSQRKLNLMGHLVHMRRQREKLVQTVEQYIFCHEAVRMLIRHGITRVHSDLFQRYLDFLGEENANGKSRIQMQFEDLCQCKHKPACSLPEDFVILPGYHRQDEFIVASWSQENEQLWELVWGKNCQTLVLLGDNSYWVHLDRVGEMSLQHGEQFVILQNKEDQLCVRIILINPSVLESNFWEEVERLQKERLVYHDAPLLILNPIQKLHTTSSLSRNGGIVTSIANGSPLSQTLSLPCLVASISPSLAYCMCALTSLACQLETTGCLDVVSTVSSYHRLHCGIWQSLQDIEFIYDQLTSLVGGSRV